MPGFKQIQRFFITAKTATPLRQLLADHLPAPSDAETVIGSGGVWKDRKRVTDPDTIIPAQETVKVHISSFQGKAYTLEKEHIIFENPDFMVVYKPCDLNVHSVPSSFYYNLAYGVSQYLRQQGIDYHVTPVTRLDRPVEGLVIFPKHKSSEIQLFKSVKLRQVKKWYTAVLGTTKGPRCLRIRDTLSNLGNRTFSDEKGKAADSLFIKTGSVGNADIYSVFIFTGRRHQIRFHASHYIAPVLGDWFYGSATVLQDDDTALICRGYNIPYRRETFKIRLPQHYLDRFFEKVGRHPHK